MIEIKDLKKQFGSLEVLKGINLDKLPTGIYVVEIGGKSFKIAK